MRRSWTAAIGSTRYSLISLSSASSFGPAESSFWTTTGGPPVRSAARYFEPNMGWSVVPGAFDSGTIDAQTGRARLLALRLPNPPFEPAFEHFQPF
jgi:hypothetical protein